MDEKWFKCMCERVHSGATQRPPFRVVGLCEHSVKATSHFTDKETKMLQESSQLVKVPREISGRAGARNWASSRDIRVVRSSG